MQRINDLKDCPFCGQKATMVHTESGYGVGCIGNGKCRGDISRSYQYKTIEEAMEAWNRRNGDERA